MKKIKITNCVAYGPQFANLISGSVHEVIKKKFATNRPSNKRKRSIGYWVKGVSENVVVLHNECELI